jgi:2-oxoacid:acceptor oxidoreductase gamma subunit (pyruvate/2-ketoisovalerate family)/2-oxoacid:acceptor oxidoreductase delta subunit (pyruvate/2-ketoisovalerate family)
MIRVRLHGRGGHGVKTAGRIVGSAAFHAGFHGQDAPVYGAERRGAAVASYAWLDRGPIRERGMIARPDLIVLADETLLADPASGVLAGADSATALFVNTDRVESLALPEALRSRVIAIDLTSRTLAALGRAAALSASLGAATVRLLGAIPLEALIEALRDELMSIGVAPAELAKNEQLARDVFAALEPLAVVDSGSSLTLAPRGGYSATTQSVAAQPGIAPPVAAPSVAAQPVATQPIVVLPVVDRPSGPQLEDAQPSDAQPSSAQPSVVPQSDTLARVEYEGVMRGTPSVLAGGNSAARHTGAWRVQRPVIDPALCSRCGLCFVQCPDGVISLDAEGYPVIDYDHCKGCLLCHRVCPVKAIHEERETRAW